MRPGKLNNKIIPGRYIFFRERKKFMRNKITNTIGQIHAGAAKLKQLPLTNVKYHLSSKIYNLCLLIDEFNKNPKLRRENHYSNDGTGYDSNTIAMLTSFRRSLFQVMQDIIAAQDEVTLQEIIDTFSSDLALRMVGWINLPNVHLPGVAHNESIYENDCFNLNEEKNNSQELQEIFDPMFTAVSSCITTHRPTLNVFMEDSLFKYISSADMVKRASMIKYLCRFPKTVNDVSSGYKFNCYLHLNNHCNETFYEKNDNESFIKMICGNREDVRISNQFDVGVVMTRCLIDFSGFGSSVPLDDDFKANFFRCNTQISKDGIMVLIMPKIFLNYATVHFISSYMDDLQFIYTDTDKHIGFVAIVGYKKPKFKPDLAKSMEIMVRILSENSSDIKPLAVKTIAAEKITFRGAAPVKSEVLKAINRNFKFIAKNNNAAKRTIKLDIDEEKPKPLLPFSAGQLGLVLVSGKIDGVIDEGNGYYHVIKGSVYKTQNQDTTVDEDGNTVITTTVGNGTSVTMLTADGNFVTLR